MTQSTEVKLAAQDTKIVNVKYKKRSIKTKIPEMLKYTKVLCPG